MTILNRAAIVRGAALGALFFAGTGFAEPPAPQDGADTTVRATLAAIDALDEKGRRIAQSYLKDREPGEPVQCIGALRVRRDTAPSDDLFLYEGTDGVVYANAPLGGCNGARLYSRISQRTSPRQCAGDIIIVDDLFTGSHVGSCALSAFVPFRKVDAPGD